MEPMLPMPSQSENKPASSEQGGGQSAELNESFSVSNQERIGEMQPISQPMTHSAPPIDNQQPVANSAPAVNPGQPNPTTAAPLIADDVDVIEKEWVDKAKKIVSSTNEDPHNQEKQVSELQADYLMKRYNKKIKLAE